MRRWLLRSTAEPNECAILELSRVGVSSGNSYTHRRGERQKPRGGIPSRDKSYHRQNEGLSTQTRFYLRNHCSEWWEKWWLSAALARKDGYKIQELLALSYRCSGSQRRQGRSMGDYGIWRTSQHEQKAEFVAASRCSECSMYDAVGGMWGFQRNFAPGWKVMMEGVWCRSD